MFKYFISLLLLEFTGYAGVVIVAVFDSSRRMRCQKVTRYSIESDIDILGILARTERRTCRRQDHS
jgi:hypothetical protein